MWQQVGSFILRYRLALLISLAGVTGLMAYFASKVQLSYDFSRAIPVNNPKYIAYWDFKKQFGEDRDLVGDWDPDRSVVQ